MAPIRALGCLLSCLVTAAACGTAGGRASTPSPSAAAPGTGTLTVYGAASLRDVLTSLAEAYRAVEEPGLTIHLSFDASSALRAQIEQGAPADLFVSADPANAQALVDEHLATGPATVVAGTELTIVVPAPGNGPVRQPFDLAKPGVRYVAAGSAVPITVYAQQVIANLGRLPGAPAGFVASVAANTVSREDNVRAVLTKIELGDGDAAIVYQTDARTSKLVQSIALPVSVNVPATYEAVVPSGTGMEAAARRFLAWLLRPSGQAIFARYGFLPPP
jgi:molybdate transport system substrate-binding protein